METLLNAEKYAESVLNKVVTNNINLKDTIMKAYIAGVNETLNSDDVNSEDYQNVLNFEQIAFENGIVDDYIAINMDESDINQQTLMFKELRDNK